MKWVLNGLESLSRNPFFGGVTAVLGVVAGVCGSLYTTEIKGSFPFVWQPVALSHEAALFWLLLIVFLFMFFSTQWAQNRAANRAQKELVSAQRELMGKSDQLVTKSDQLERLVRTMPPEDFLIQFNDFCTISYKAAVIAFTQELTPVGAEKAIRVILECIVSLAHFFDGSPNDAKYSANIMLFLSADTMDTAKREEIKARLHFTPEDVDIGALCGVLDLELPLSTTQENAGGPDTGLAPFALPVPRKPHHDVNGERKYKVLPGAPWAHVYRSAAGFSDLAEFEHWARNQGDFSPGTINDMLEYFQTGKGRNIKCFFSVPLILREGEDPIGVLNVHRNVKGMLGERAMDLFLPFTSPFRLLLAELIELRQQRLDV